MATVTVHDVDEEALERLRVETERRGGTVEAELRAFIEDPTRRPDDIRRGRAKAAMQALYTDLEQLRTKYEGFPDTTEMIRQDRAAW